MRRKARIVTLIPRRSESNRQVSIPKGCCELDDGPHGTGPYMVYWRQGEHTVSFELTLTEFVSYVDVEVQPWPSVRAMRHDQPFTRDQRWNKH